MTLVWTLSALQYDQPREVPEQEKAGASAETLQVEVHLTDGSTMRGKVSLRSVPLRTAYTQAKIKPQFVSGILFTHDGEATVHMKNGDRVKGTIALASFAMETLLGRFVIPLNKVESLHFLSSDTVPGEGLVAYYPLDGNAEDASGKGNNGNVHGAVPAPDRFGRPAGALRFNGVASYVQVPDDSSLRPTAGLSVCA